MIGLPFTIATVLLSVAMLTSKFQDGSTRFMVACYSIFGTFESGSLFLTLILYLGDASRSETVQILLIISLSFIYIINFLGFLIITPYLLSDRKFMKWTSSRAKREDCRCNLFMFHVINVCSFLTNYKLKMLIFSRLFGFNCFNSRLEDIAKFRLFNVLSFIGLVPQVIFVYCGVVSITGVDRSSALFVSLVDSLVVFVLNILLSVVVSKKEMDFFSEELEGVSLNQIYNVADEQFQSGAVIISELKKQGQNREVNSFNLEDISEYDEFAYRTTKRQGKLRKREGGTKPIEEVCNAEGISEQNTGNMESERKGQFQAEQAEEQVRQSRGRPQINEKILTDQNQAQPDTMSFRRDESANKTGQLQSQLNQAKKQTNKVVIFDQNLNDESEDYYSSSENQEREGDRIAQPVNRVNIPTFHGQSVTDSGDRATGIQMQTHIRLSDYLQANRHKKVEPTKECNHSNGFESTDPSRTNPLAYNPVTSHKLVKREVSNNGNQKIVRGEQRGAMANDNSYHEQKPIRSRSREGTKSNYPINLSNKNKSNLQLGRGGEGRGQNDDLAIDQLRAKPKPQNGGRKLKQQIQTSDQPDFATSSLFMANFNDKAQFHRIPQQLAQFNRTPSQPIQFLLSVTLNQTELMKQRMRLKSNQVYSRRGSSSGKAIDRSETATVLKGSKSCEKKMTGLQRIYRKKGRS